MIKITNASEMYKATVDSEYQLILANIYLSTIGRSMSTSMKISYKENIVRLRNEDFIVNKNYCYYILGQFNYYTISWRND